MNASALSARPADPDRREPRDRLELLTALINSPGFDPVFRDDVIRIPPGHRIYPWRCAVRECERSRWAASDLCANHTEQWRQARAGGVGKSVFVLTADPMTARRSIEEIRCRICPERPAFDRHRALCQRHLKQWRAHRHRRGEDADLDEWLLAQRPYRGYGGCQLQVCEGLAETPLGLCTVHHDRYHVAGRPGGAALPDMWAQRLERCGLPVPVSYEDETAFRQ